MRYISDYVWSWNYPRLHLRVLLNNNLLVEIASSIFFGAGDLLLGCTALAGKNLTSSSSTFPVLSKSVYAELDYIRTSSTFRTKNDY